MKFCFVYKQLKNIIGEYDVLCLQLKICKLSIRFRLSTIDI